MHHHDDSIDKVLDRLNDMREQLVSIERSLERIQAAKPSDSSDQVSVGIKNKG